jgi:hypothetical protein
MCGKTRRDMIRKFRNDNIKKRVGVAPLIVKKIVET